MNGIRCAVTGVTKIIRALPKDPRVLLGLVLLLAVAVVLLVTAGWTGWGAGSESELGSYGLWIGGPDHFCYVNFPHMGIGCQ